MGWSKFNYFRISCEKNQNVEETTEAENQRKQ